MSESDGFLNFRIIVRGQTYLNIVYHLITFPVGLVSFIVLAAGFSVGIGLSILWIGVIILALTLVAARGLARVERVLARFLLGIALPAPPVQPVPKRFSDHVKQLFADSRTGKSVLYLLVKMPLEVCSFSMTVSLLSASLALTFSPLLAYGPWHVGDSFWWYYWTDASPLLVAASMVLGITLGFLSLHILKALAWVSGELTRILLVDTE